MIFGLPTAVAGSIIAAVIAGIISLLGLIISKETKVSEFRQAWIDSLRAEVAAVITHAQAVHGAYLAKFIDKPTLWQNVREDCVGLNEAWAKVKLRLNPREPKSTDILSALEEHESVFQPDKDQPDKEPAFENLDAAEKKLLAATKIVLREEWRRVKWGEPMYRGATLFAGVLVIVGFLLLWKSFGYSLGSSNLYHVVERTDIYVDKEGRAASDQSFDHDVVHLVLDHSNHKIYAECDLSTLNKLDPNASCGLRPLRDYECVVGRDDMMKAPSPLSDLVCKDADERTVYLYVSKQE